MGIKKRPAGARGKQRSQVWPGQGRAQQTVLLLLTRKQDKRCNVSNRTGTVARPCRTVLSGTRRQTPDFSQAVQRASHELTCRVMYLSRETRSRPRAPHESTSPATCGGTTDPGRWSGDRPPSRPEMLPTGPMLSGRRSATLPRWEIRVRALSRPASARRATCAQDDRARDVPEKPLPQITP